MERFNSPENQDIKKGFVEREVYACVTLVVEYILAKSQEDPNAPLSWDDTDNLYQYEDENGNVYSEQQRNSLLENLQEELEDLTSTQTDEDSKEMEMLEEKISCLEGAEEQIKEVLEWWIVSKYLADMLSNHDEIVITDGLVHYWGRTCSGQAIFLDHVISEICAERNLLKR